MGNTAEILDTFELVPPLTKIKTGITTVVVFSGDFGANVHAALQDHIDQPFSGSSAEEALGKLARSAWPSNIDKASAMLSDLELGRLVLNECKLGPLPLRIIFSNVDSNR